MEKVTINVYQLKELDKHIQNMVIDEHREFLISIYSNDMFDESFNMTRSKYAKSLHKSEVIESIECNKYFYFKNGKIADCVEYTNSHPKAGKREITLNGETYEF